MKTIFLNPGDSFQDALDEAAKSKCKSRIILCDGEYAGAKKARLFYDSPFPLEIIGSGAKNCSLKGENCEAFHKDTENRAILTFGEKCTRVFLSNFEIENAHVKTKDDYALGNQAEALCWHNQTGFLKCEKMRFKSRQDTIHVKGFSFFSECEILGDVDFIWGYCDTAFFENCKITTIRDNRGGNRPAFVLQSRAKNARPGFVFSCCDFFAEERADGGEIFIGRSAGTGAKDSVDRWDSIALLDCTLDENYSKELWTDENGTRSVFPQKGTANCGWREWKTRFVQKDGSIFPLDASKQEKHGQSLSKDETDFLLRTVSQILLEKEKSVSEE